MGAKISKKGACSKCVPKHICDSPLINDKKCGICEKYKLKYTTEVLIVEANEKRAIQRFKEEYGFLGIKNNCILHKLGENRGHFYFYGHYCDNCYDSGFDKYIV
jgi:hypothetical protein